MWGLVVVKNIVIKGVDLVVKNVRLKCWSCSICSYCHQNQCKSDDLIMNQKTRRLLLCCIKSVSSCLYICHNMPLTVQFQVWLFSFQLFFALTCGSSFNSENIRNALCERINYASSQISLSYIRQVLQYVRIRTYICKWKCILFEDSLVSVRNLSLPYTYILSYLLNGIYYLVRLVFVNTFRAFSVWNFCLAILQVPPRCFSSG